MAEATDAFSKEHYMNISSKLYELYDRFAHHIGNSAEAVRLAASNPWAALNERMSTLVSESNDIANRVNSLSVDFSRLRLTNNPLIVSHEDVFITIRNHAIVIRSDILSNIKNLHTVFR